MMYRATLFLLSMLLCKVRDLKGLYREGLEQFVFALHSGTQNVYHGVMRDIVLQRVKVRAGVLVQSLSTYDTLAAAGINGD